MEEGPQIPHQYIDGAGLNRVPSAVIEAVHSLTYGEGRVFLTFLNFFLLYFTSGRDNGSLSFIPTFPF